MTKSYSSPKVAVGTTPEYNSKMTVGAHAPHDAPPPYRQHLLSPPPSFSSSPSPANDINGYQQQPLMSTVPGGNEEGYNKWDDMKGQPGYICSDNGGQFCSNRGGYVCSDNGGRFCSNRGGYVCSDRGGRFCSDREGECCSDTKGVCCASRGATCCS